MAVDVVDLVSSSDDESPTKLLKTFQKTKSKHASSPGINGNLHAEHAASQSRRIQHEHAFTFERHLLASNDTAETETWAGSADGPSSTARINSYSPAVDVVESLETTQRSHLPAHIPAGVRAAFGDGPGNDGNTFRPEQTSTSNEMNQQSESQRRERVEKAGRYHDQLASRATQGSSRVPGGNIQASSGNHTAATVASRPFFNGEPSTASYRAERSAALEDFINGTSVEEESPVGPSPEVGRVKRPFPDLTALPSMKRPRTQVQDDVKTSVESSKAREIQLVDVTANTERISKSDEPSPPTGSRKHFTSQDNALLKRLKDVENLNWNEITSHFPGRTKAALQVHYCTKVKKSGIAPAKGSLTLPQPAPASGVRDRPPATTAGPGRGKSGHPYSAAEDALLKRLKEEEGLSWAEMVSHFQGRTEGSIAVRWYTKIKVKQADHRPSAHDGSEMFEAAAPRSKRARKSNISATEGFVSWTEAKALMRDGASDEASEAESAPQARTAAVTCPNQDSVYPLSMLQILRHRETGVTAGRKAWTSSRIHIPEELKDNVLKGYTVDSFFQGTSGDVVGLSWSADGKHFAAGSIAITDSRSMQYNMSRNLLVGDRARGDLQELLDHHVARPIVDEADNPNALTSMRQTQDPRLFLTVTATAFSPVKGKEHWLFTAGTDKMLRRYSVAGNGIGRTELRYAAEHAASVDLIAVHPDRSFVATGCHSASQSINIHTCDRTQFKHVWTGSPERRQLDTAANIFPSALKWGEAPAHRKYLLAGFSGDDEDKDLAGETALWDFEHTQRVEIRGTTRSVFDVAWNPSPSPTSVSFAVACNSVGLNTGKGMRTAVRCFAPTEKGLQAVMQWECPALDINDVVICPHDENLIAVGSTDGKVYVWDQRFANRDRGQKPLHVLEHGVSLNVLPPDRNRELTDTGVRFLSWGATKNRLYSGSSDGIVKVWNPYRSPDNAHLEDIALPRQQRAAIMSGIFNPDHRELLIGTENGQINLLTMSDSGSTHKPKAFKLHTGRSSAEQQQQHDSPSVTEDFIRSGEIEYRRCGAMPITQAVQGPAYAGPFQAPSTRDLNLAESKLQVALDAQNELASERAQAGRMDLDDDVDLYKAQLRVREAQAGVEDLQARLDFAQESRPQAIKFQQTLVEAENDRKLLLMRERARFGDNAAACKLPDCGHVEHIDELEDNERSQLRVPATLRLVTKESIAKSELRHEDEAEPCSICSPAGLTRKTKTKKCLSCSIRSLSLTATCKICSAPAPVATDGQDMLCGRCAFECFRCSGPVRFLKGGSLVSCDHCNLTWTAGALGYDLNDKAPCKRESAAEASDWEDYDDFGTHEREALASRWEVQLPQPSW